MSDAPTEAINEGSDPVVPSRFNAAIQYMMQGLQPVPVSAGEKGPRYTGWNTELIRLEEFETRFGGEGNIGILLGEPSGGIVDVDLDCPEALELADPILPPTAVTTGRASTPRSHRWYSASGLSSEMFKDPVTGEMIVEIRSTGGQTLVGPSIHPETGERYDMLEGQPPEVDGAQLAAAVGAIYEAVVAKRYPDGVPAKAATRANLGQTVATGPRVPTPRDDQRVFRRAKGYLAKMEAAVSGCGGHDRTYAAATCMVHGFGLEPDVAFDLLMNEYNPRCQPPWSEKEIGHKVNDAATKEHMLPYGWLRDAAPPSRSQKPSSLPGVPSDAGEVVDTAADEGGEEADAAGGASGPIDPGPFPQHLLHVPGFIGQVMEHNLSTALRPQPILALAGAIVLQGVLAGRKVRDELDNRTNIYAVCVARSGAGKDHARKLNREILIKSGQAHLEPCEDLASDAGLTAAVEASPACILQHDEFGRFLKTAADCTRSPHLYAITTQLIRLYSSANTTYLGKAYADLSNRKSINQPCLNLLGTTVPKHFMGAMTPDNLIDGLLGRIFVFEGQALAPRHRRRTRPQLPQSVIDIAIYWRDFKPGGNLAGQNPDPIIVITEADAEDVFDAFAAEIEPAADCPEEDAALWARAEENARKLALVYACSENHQNPRISAAAARWACDVVRHLVLRLLYLAHRWVSESPFQAKCKRVLRAIDEGGGRLDRGMLLRKVQSMSARELDEVIEFLEASEQIAVKNIKTKGRTKVTYVRI